MFTLFIWYYKRRRVGVRRIVGEGVGISIVRGLGGDVGGKRWKWR